MCPLSVRLGVQRVGAPAMKPLAVLVAILAAVTLRRVLREFSTPAPADVLVYGSLIDDDWLIESDVYTAALARRVAA